jgi:hypothetical protein
MNSKDFYSEIAGIQKRLKSVDSDELYRELQHLIGSHPWRSPLIYGGLYIRQTGSTAVSVFFARKTLEAIEEVCERGTEEDRETLLGSQTAGRVYKLGKKPGVKPILAKTRLFFKRKTAKRTLELGHVVAPPQDLYAPQAASESEELRLTRKRRDELLVAMTFLVLAFDNTALRARIRVAEQRIAGKIRRIRQGFVDKVPLNDYLVVLGQQFQENEEVVKPLGTFFDELIRNAGLEKTPSFGQRAAKLKECVELLIEEAGRRIEKPDRMFSCADSLDSISRYAESLFDVGGEGGDRFFNKYKWAYPRGRSFENLNAFWTACMIGLFAFGQALDRSVALAQVSEQADVDVAHTETKGEGGSVARIEGASRKSETQQKKTIFRDIGTNLKLKRVVSS